MAAAAPVVFGFVGLGIMGRPMAANILKKLPHASLVVWNRSPAAAEAFVAECCGRARAAASPREVAAASSVTFAMLADPAAARSVALGSGGVVEGISAGNVYCDMSTIDAESARAIAAGVRASGGLFLEAPVSGSKQPAIDGQLVVLAAGDANALAAAAPALDAMGKKTFFYGADVGKGAAMKLVINMTMESMLVALSEGLALAEGSGLASADLLAAIDLGAIASPLVRGKGPMMAAGGPHAPAFPLKHAAKDLRLALAAGAAARIDLPVAAAASARFEAALAAGRGDEDMAAVHGKRRA
jgi:glyoxylate/succinic semialdehyde reductase